MAYNSSMSPLTTVFSFLVAASGWYYMFYSRAAANLNGIENDDINDRRQRLRRVGGFVMLLLGVALFAGFNSVDSATGPQGFLFVWLAVFVLLLTIVLLAIVDLRLTWKLRDRRNRLKTRPPENLP